MFESFKITSKFNNETQVFPLFSSNGGQIEDASTIQFDGSSVWSTNYNSSVVMSLLFARPWGKLK